MADTAIVVPSAVRLEEKPPLEFVEGGDIEFVEGGPVTPVERE